MIRKVCPNDYTKYVRDVKKMYTNIVNTLPNEYNAINIFFLNKTSNIQQFNVKRHTFNMTIE